MKLTVKAAVHFRLMNFHPETQYCIPNFLGVVWQPIYLWESLDFERMDGNKPGLQIEGWLCIKKELIIYTQQGFFFFFYHNPDWNNW